MKNVCDLIINGNLNIIEIIFPIVVIGIISFPVILFAIALMLPGDKGGRYIP